MKTMIVVRATQAQLFAATRISEELGISRPEAIRLSVKYGLRQMYDKLDDISHLIERGSNPTQMWFDEPTFDDIDVMKAKFSGCSRSSIVRAALQIGAEAYGKSWKTPEECGG